MPRPKSLRAPRTPPMPHIVAAGGTPHELESLLRQLCILYKQQATAIEDLCHIVQNQQGQIQKLRDALPHPRKAG